MPVSHPSYKVSIHTPAGGATLYQLIKLWSLSCFNPHARGGRDRRWSERLNEEKKFQSTRPRGARPIGIAVCQAFLASFNPHARGGRDLGEVERIRPSRAFQSTRPRGARPRHDLMRSAVILFQSTRPRGARLRWNGCADGFGEFQSTRPRGARRDWKEQLELCLDVSIHTPAGGATFRYDKRVSIS